jgi:hypothetical protein
MPFQPDTRVLDKFIEWIEKPEFEPQHAKNWARQYKADPEAATCEAMFWGVLTDCGVTVIPNRDLTGNKSSPDFLCEKDGQKFYVEVTCIQIEKATRETTLPHVCGMEVQAQSFGNLNRAIFGEVVNKTPQCANLDAPCIVAVGTFHFQASSVCVDKWSLGMLLTGDEMITRDFDTSKGETVGETYISTRLEKAAFIRFGRDGALEHARSPVSAVLVGGFGCREVNIVGILHPRAARPFTPGLLSRIEFGRLNEDYASGRLSVEWV